MKTTISRSSVLMIVLAGALLAPAQLWPQEREAARTHRVRRGETLWSIAADSLGDGNRWREILALNPNLRSVRSLVTGSTIRLPGARPPQPAAAPPRPVAPTPVPAERPAPTTAPRDTGGRTIFFGARPAGGFASRDSIPTAPAKAAVPASAFEAMSAPFVVDSGTFDRGGRCLSVGPAAVSEAGGVLLSSTLSIQTPGAAAAEAGSRWILVRRGPVLAGLGAVAIPTVVVRLTSATTGGAATAEVVAQFDAMSCSDVVLPLGETPSMPGGRLTTVSDGARGRVAWVASESLLPTLQHALILDIGASAGVRVGDRVTIYAQNSSAIVASADVIRVEQRTATALVVRQSLGALAAGLPVRVTEKLP